MVAVGILEHGALEVSAVSATPYCQSVPAHVIISAQR